MALLLAAGEALVDAALGEGRVHLEVAHGRLDVLDPRAQLGGLAVDRGLGRAQEVADRDTGDLDGILHREEEAGAGALVDGHGEHVLAVERHGAAGDGVLRVAGDAVGERRLAGAVGTHDRVRLAGPHGEVDPAQDLLGAVLGLDRDGESLDLERVLVLIGSVLLAGVGLAYGLSCWLGVCWVGAA